MTVDSTIKIHKKKKKKLASLRDLLSFLKEGRKHVNPELVDGNDFSAPTYIEERHLNTNNHFFIFDHRI